MQHSAMQQQHRPANLEFLNSSPYHSPSSSPYSSHLPSRFSASTQSTQFTTSTRSRSNSNKPPIFSTESNNWNLTSPPLPASPSPKSKSYLKSNINRSSIEEMEVIMEVTEKKRVISRALPPPPPVTPPPFKTPATPIQYQTPPFKWKPHSPPSRILSETLPLRLSTHSRSQSLSSPFLPSLTEVKRNSLLSSPSPRFSNSKRPKAIPPSVTVLPTFSAMILQESSGSHQGLSERLIELNVGGTLITTLATTLLKAGHLGAFILETYDKETGSAVTIGKKEEDDYTLVDDSNDSILAQDHFAISPFPSPFPFMRFTKDISNDLPRDSSPLKEIEAESIWFANSSSSQNQMEESLPESPTSPIDPFRPRMFGSISIPKVEFIKSPLPKARVQSIHPDIGFGGSIDDFLELSIGGSDLTPNAIELNDLNENPFFAILPNQTYCSPKLLFPLPPSATTFKASPIMKQKESEFLVESSTGSRPPSLSMSFSTSSGGEIDSNLKPFNLPISTKSTESKNLIIFLDRSVDEFKHILHYLRTNQLPATHSVPDSTVFLSLNPNSILIILNNLKNLDLEAKWFGIDALGSEIEVEIKKVSVLVNRIISEKKAKLEGKMQTGWI